MKISKYDNYPLYDLEKLYEHISDTEDNIDISQIKCYVPEEISEEEKMRRMDESICIDKKQRAEFVKFMEQSHRELEETHQLFLNDIAHIDEPIDNEYEE